MARRRKYNPSQKRDFHGRWATGSLGGLKTTGAAPIKRSSSVVSATGGNTKRYDAFLAKQAQQKSAARRTNIKRAALGAVVVGAAGAGAYIGSRGKNKGTKDAPLGNVAHVPVKSQGPTVPFIGKITEPTKMETAPSPSRTVSTAPVHAKAVNGTEVKPTKPVAKPNPTSSPVAAKVTSGVSTVQSERELVSLKRKTPKVKSNPTSNPIPTPGALITEDGKHVKIVKGLNDAERIRLENNAVKAASDLHKLEKKAGVNVGSTARRDFDKKNKAKRTKAQAKLDANEAARLKRREDMSKAISDSFGAGAVVKATGSRRDRAEARYVSILENMLNGGTALNRSQRKFLKDYGV